MFVKVWWIWWVRERRRVEAKGVELKVQKPDMRWSRGLVSWVRDGWLSGLSSHDNISRFVDSFSLVVFADIFHFISFPSSGIIFHSTPSTHIRHCVRLVFRTGLNDENIFQSFFYYNIIKQNTFEWCLISVWFFPFFGAIRFGTSAATKKQFTLVFLATGKSANQKFNGFNI